MKNKIYMMILLSFVFAACESGDWEFPDYEYQSVYFAHQSPVRTITLGEDIVDTSFDNEWKFRIMATTGGVYNNENNIEIGVSVSNELLNNLAFQGSGNNVLPLPSNYYTLASDQITIPKGQLTGGVEVQLTEEFFTDPLSIGNNYVLPLIMNNLTNADSILSGVPLVENPNRLTPGDWVVRPKDYVLYAVKYINPWHGYYLRRGVDQITGEVDSTVVRHGEYVEDDEVNLLTTRSLNELELPLVYRDDEGGNVNCTLILTFDDSGKCTISSGTAGYTATGSGQFIKDGEKKSWGDQDRDALYLSYDVDLDSLEVSAVDTLVMRNRGVAFEEFIPALQ
ncbi:MAG: DUF5627 domain-containing protein [Cyclobacteriaceae bacterium]